MSRREPDRLRRLGPLWDRARTRRRRRALAFLAAVDAADEPAADRSYALMMEAHGLVAALDRLP